MDKKQNNFQPMKKVYYIGVQNFVRLPERLRTQKKNVGVHLCVCIRDLSSCPL